MAFRTPQFSTAILISIQITRMARSFESFITIKMKHLILYLGVLYAVCVSWSYGYSNEEFLEQWNCISESGDEHLCNEFQDCNTLIPQCYFLPYSYCVRNIVPNGPGHCSKTEQAYGSEKQRLEVNKCFSDITTLANGDDWTSIPELADFLVFLLSISSDMLINYKYFTILSLYRIRRRN
ncbi:hypothetical protein AVEN_251671-1 [Araneus ventricosus]|uniref:Uncharacterized protein n=1 Tax=Araneus ventricosus TaxID=182803 RepID=A0A4Y2HFH7_ARAVE|nr:hypothetical protein AVEN_251671-1 [Araneus ventricosus]